MCNILSSLYRGFIQLITTLLYWHQCTFSLIAIYCISSILFCLFSSKHNLRLWCCLCPIWWGWHEYYDSNLSKTSTHYYKQSLGYAYHVIKLSQHWFIQLFDAKWLPEPMWTYLICLLEIFKLISVMDDWNIFHEIVLRCLSLDFIGDKLILLQVMAWCHQATILT